VQVHNPTLFFQHSISRMSKAFTRESDSSDDEDDIPLPPSPGGGKNYITPAGYARLRQELLDLIDNERPKVVEVVHWAASNGDRSENGDYLYGKKRLREIDRRIRFLTKRLEIAEVTNPCVHHGNPQVFFGATVTYVDQADVGRVVTILGIDEADSARGEVTWVSPIARTLLKSRVGDVLHLMTPAGISEIEVLSVEYPPPEASAAP
jgi:transcription elongation factor GreB